LVGASSYETVPTQDRRAPARHGACSSRRGLVAIFPRQLDAAPSKWRIDRPAILGRGHTADVRLSDERVSRAHAQVTPHTQGLVLRDCGSRHGVFVDGKKISPAGSVAEDGAIVRVGDTLLAVVENVDRHGSIARRLESPFSGAPVVLAGPELAGVWDEAARVAELPDPILVLGESGSGKESVARIIHRAWGGPFVAVNVAAIPGSLFEAELFGYERGAFTGATAARAGAFRDAARGVLFLDEVGDLPLELQSKLLRAIDAKRVRPLGASRDIPVEARIVSATSRDLRTMCREGAFRTDLYYRLAGIILQVPPLRQRRDDVILLALSFLSERPGGLQLSTDAAEMLALAPWEGNVRNLRYAITHAIGRALSSGRTEIGATDLPDLRPVHDLSTELTEERIRSAIKAAGGVVAHAAEALGVSRTTLYNAIRRLNVDVPTLRAADRKNSGQ
jgi:transcriptional regulator with PAS, ATPase and Fis domain